MIAGNELKKDNSKILVKVIIYDFPPRDHVCASTYQYKSYLLINKSCNIEIVD